MKQLIIGSLLLTASLHGTGIKRTESFGYITYDDGRFHCYQLLANKSYHGYEYEKFNAQTLLEAYEGFHFDGNLPVAGIVRRVMLDEAQKIFCALEGTWKKQQEK